MNVGGGVFTSSSLAAAASAQIFKTFSVAGQSDVVADANSDSITFAAGSNMTITTNAGTDTITFASSVESASSAQASYQTLTTDANQFVPFFDGADGGKFYTDGGLLYNPNDNTLTTDLIGNASTATTSSAASATYNSLTTDANQFVPFFDGADGGKFYTDAGLLYNPSTNKLDTDVTGNADTATTASAVVSTYNSLTTNQNQFVPFFDHSTGGKLYTDGGLLYNPSTNKLDTDVTGNADTATTASAITATAENTNANRYVPFFAGSAGGDLLVDNSNLLFNPSTNTLTVTNISGTATNATTATSASKVDVDANSSNSDQAVPFLTNYTSGHHQLRTDSSDSFTYNPSSNTLTVPNISGNASTSTSASKVDVDANASNSDHAIPFLTNYTSGHHQLRTDSSDSFKYNPSTNTLTVPNISGATIGNADSASKVASTANSSDSDQAVPFLTSYTTGNHQLRTDSGDSFTYNPSSNTLTVPNIAGTATNADSASKVASTANSSDSNHAIPFLTSYTTGNHQLRTDSGNVLTYNPSSNTLAVTNVTLSGNLTVNGTTTTIDSTTINLGDRIIELNADSAGGDGGLYVRDASGNQTGSLLWDVSENRWMGGLKDAEVNLVTISSTDTLTNKTLTNPTLSGHIIGNISGSLSSTGSFGAVEVVGMSVPNVTRFSSSIASRVAALDAASSGITISNNVNNRVLTGDGSNANAEANLLFDGTKLSGSAATTGSFGHLMVGGGNFTSASLAAGGGGGTGTGFPFTGSAGLSGSMDIIGSGSNIFTVDGTNGRLFSVSDAMSGSIFSANLVSGLPVIEAFSDNIVKIGKFSNPIIISGSGVISGSATSTASFGHLMVGGGNFTSASLAGGGGGGGTITALNNQTANRLVTIGSTTTELDGEANLTFDGTTLTLGASTTGSFKRLEAAGNLGVNGGIIDLKNGGAQSELRLYCEVSNAHYASLKAPAHSDFAGNVTLTLPATTDTIVGRTTTDTLTNKTLTSPDINTPDIDGGTIDDTVIGGSTKAAGSFTTLTATGNVSSSLTSTGSFGGIFSSGVSRFNGNVIISGQTDNLIHNNTSDASDNKSIRLDGGGGGGSSTRGAFVAVHGNEHGSDPGELVLQSGNVTGAAITFRGSGGVDMMEMTKEGTLNIGQSNGTGNVSGSSTSTGSFGHLMVGGGNFTSASLAAGGSGGETNQNAFSTIAVAGQDNVVADSATDTLTLVAGSNVTLTTDASGDSVTIAAAGGGGGSGAVSAVANGSDNRIATFSSADALNGEANLTFDGTILSGSAATSASFGHGHFADKVGIGTTSPDGTLHVHTGTAGTMTAHVSADDLVVEKDDHGGISILTPNNRTGAIYFGDVEDNNIGALHYNHSLNKLILTVAAADRFSLSANTAEFDSTITKISGSASSTGSFGHLMVGGGNFTSASLAAGGGGGGGSVSEAFKTISVAGQSDVVADSATDTLTLVAGSNMTLTTNASGDSITFASSGGGGGGGTNSGSFTFVQAGDSANWAITHSLGTKHNAITVYDDTHQVVIPTSITADDSNKTTITFSSPTAGYAVVNSGGTTGTVTRVSTDGSHVHYQAGDSANWPITHSLNSKYPNVTVYDDSDEVVIPTSIKADTVDTATVTFSSPTAGRAIFSMGGNLSGSLTSTGSFGRVDAQDGFYDGGTKLSVPDYVFEPEYELKSISELDTHISQSKHLPNVPDMNAFEEWKQLSMGDRDMLLLEKIEEMSLYICLLYTSPSPRDLSTSRMPSSA